MHKQHNLKTVSWTEMHVAVHSQSWSHKSRQVRRIVAATLGAPPSIDVLEARQKARKAHTDVDDVANFVNYSETDHESATLQSLLRLRMRYIDFLRASLEATDPAPPESWAALLRVLPSVTALPGALAESSLPIDARKSGEYLTCLPACLDPTAGASDAIRDAFSAAVSTAEAICNAGSALPEPLRVECHPIVLLPLRTKASDSAHIPIRLIPSTSMFRSAENSRPAHRNARRPRHHPAIMVQSETQLSQHVVAAGLIAGSALSKARRSVGLARVHETLAAAPAHVQVDMNAAQRYEVCAESLCCRTPGALAGASMLGDCSSLTVQRALCHVVAHVCDRHVMRWRMAAGVDARGARKSTDADAISIGRMWRGARLLLWRLLFATSLRPFLNFQSAQHARRFRRLQEHCAWSRPVLDRAAGQAGASGLEVGIAAAPWNLLHKPLLFRGFVHSSLQLSAETASPRASLAVATSIANSVGDVPVVSFASTVKLATHAPPKGRLLSSASTQALIGSASTSVLARVGESAPSLPRSPPPRTVIVSAVHQPAVSPQAAARELRNALQRLSTDEDFDDLNVTKSPSALACDIAADPVGLTLQGSAAVLDRTRFSATDRMQTIKAEKARYSEYLQELQIQNFIQQQREAQVEQIIAATMAYRPPRPPADMLRKSSLVLHVPDAEAVQPDPKPQLHGGFVLADGRNGRASPSIQLPPYSVLIASSDIVDALDTDTVVSLLNHLPRLVHSDFELASSVLLRALILDESIKKKIMVYLKRGGGSGLSQLDHRIGGAVNALLVLPQPPQKRPINMNRSEEGAVQLNAVDQAPLDDDLDLFIDAPTGYRRILPASARELLLGRLHVDAPWSKRAHDLWYVLSQQSVSLNAPTITPNVAASPQSLHVPWGTSPEAQEARERTFAQHSTPPPQSNSTTSIVNGYSLATPIANHSAMLDHLFAAPATPMSPMVHSSSTGSIRRRAPVDNVGLYRPVPSVYGGGTLHSTAAAVMGSTTPNAPPIPAWPTRPSLSSSSSASTLSAAFQPEHMSPSQLEHKRALQKHALTSQYSPPRLSTTADQMNAMWPAQGWQVEANQVELRPASPAPTAQELRQLSADRLAEHQLAQYMQQHRQEIEDAVSGKAKLPVKRPVAAPVHTPIPLEQRQTLVDFAPPALPPRPASLSTTMSVATLAQLSMSRTMSRSRFLPLPSGPAHVTSGSDVQDVRPLTGTTPSASTMSSFTAINGLEEQSRPQSREVRTLRSDTQPHSSAPIASHPVESKPAVVQIIESKPVDSMPLPVSVSIPIPIPTMPQRSHESFPNSRAVTAERATRPPPNSAFMAAERIDWNIQEQEPTLSPQADRAREAAPMRIVRDKQNRANEVENRAQTAIARKRADAERAQELALAAFLREQGLDPSMIHDEPEIPSALPTTSKIAEVDPAAAAQAVAAAYGRVANPVAKPQSLVFEFNTAPVVHQHQPPQRLIASRGGNNSLSASMRSALKPDRNLAALVPKGATLPLHQRPGTVQQERAPKPADARAQTAVPVSYGPPLASSIPLLPVFRDQRSKGTIITLTKQRNLHSSLHQSLEFQRTQAHQINSQEAESRSNSPSKHRLASAPSSPAPAWSLLTSNSGLTYAAHVQQPTSPSGASAQQTVVNSRSGFSVPPPPASTDQSNAWASIDAMRQRTAQIVAERSQQHAETKLQSLPLTPFSASNGSTSTLRKSSESRPFLVSANTLEPVPSAAVVSNANDALLTAQQLQQRTRLQLIKATATAFPAEPLGNFGSQKQPVLDADVIAEARSLAKSRQIGNRSSGSFFPPEPESAALPTPVAAAAVSTPAKNLTSFSFFIPTVASAATRQKSRKDVA